MNSVLFMSPIRELCILIFKYFYPFQGLLIIAKKIGWKKTMVYAVSIVVLTTMAGLIYGMV